MTDTPTPPTDEHASFDSGITLDGEHRSSIKCRRCCTDWPCLAQRFIDLTAEVHRLRIRLTDQEHELISLRAELAEQRERGERLREAGQAMADCIGFFWKPSPCEHEVNDCGPCEATRWGLLQESKEAWDAALAVYRASGPTKA